MSQENLTVNVIDKQIQAKDIAVLTLQARDEQTLPVFSAGAHIDVHVGEGLVRQYSLCSRPDDVSAYRLGVLKDPNSRGGSKAIYADVNIGDQLVISEPRNLFPLDNSAKESILVGGGIGITPMIAMAYTLKKQQQPFTLHYCCRSEDRAGFLDELKTHFGEQLRLHFDDLADEQRFIPERDLGQFTAGQHVYVCGPSGFMEWVIQSAETAGYPKANIHYEYFDASVETSGKAFTVVAEHSGVTVSVEENQTIYEALAKAGIAIDISCEKGICGTCICDVISGTPDHKDHFLTDEEKEDNDQIAVCCSRALTDTLVLDI